MWIEMLALLLTVSTPPSGTPIIYQCTTANGRLSYQDQPCQTGQQRQILIQADAIPAPAATMPAVSDTPVSAPTPPIAPSRPIAPAPTMFACLRATDGTRYLSRSGITRPYRVPLSMLGYAQQPLAHVYGSGQGMGVGMSAPELMNKPTSAMIGGGYYVQVRDVCQPLPRAAACAAAAAQYAANEAAIRQAFSDERAPLLKRRHQLDAERDGCP